MRLSLSRLALIILSLLLLPLLPAHAVNSTLEPPQFLTGTSGGFPNYGTDFARIPVGKTLVVPIVVSGSGPMTYTTTSSSGGFLPIIKTGYPVMDISVSYTGTTAVSGSVTTLVAFTSGSDDGGHPRAPLIQAATTALYGTTTTGGTGGFGTIFSTTTSGVFNSQYAFTGGTDGGLPNGPLDQFASDNFYGTTGTGGANGLGTVFQLTTTGSLTTLYSFTGSPDGATPHSGLVTGADSALYGTTTSGGTGGFGTIYKVSVSGSTVVTGSESVLYSFTGGPDGSDPEATLISGSDGNLYGTTAAGGASGQGTIFRITTGGVITQLYAFTGGADGGGPTGSVAFGTDGNLYGTTGTGGAGTFGTVFQYVLNSGSLNTLHAFTSGSDGASPFAGVTVGSDGTLFGSAVTGGTAGAGTLFRVRTTGSSFTYDTLYTFTGGKDGANPYGGVIQAKNGNLYGVTAAAGSGTAGTVFQLGATTTAPFSGDMTFAMLRDMAPNAVNHVSTFAQSGYYNGTPDHPLEFFRITNLSGSTFTPGFIAQAGGPTNSGTDSPGFAYDNECNPSLIFAGAGQLALANAGENNFHGTNGSEFYVTQSNAVRFLDFSYTIFGQLLTGYDTMAKVMAVQTGTDGETPTVPVVINSVSVSEDNTDAIMLVSAGASVPNGATIKVNAVDVSGTTAVTPSTTGTTSTPGLTLSLSTFDDTTNDPPIIQPDPNVFAALHQRVSLPIKGIDLEYDFMSPNATIASGSNASVTTSGNVAIVTPTPSDPIGGVDVGLEISEPFDSSDPTADTAVAVGLGSGKLTPQPVMLTATTGGLLFSSTSDGLTNPATNFGSFISSDPKATASRFSATINWGDGTLTTGTATISSGTAGLVTGTDAGSMSVVAKSPNRPTTFDVTYPGGHAYSGPGIYPLYVTVSDSNGGVLNFQDTAVVSDSNIYAYGRTFTAVKGSFDGQVASFIDRAGTASVTDYDATIDWGDGAFSTGAKILKSGGTFQVFGKHKYGSGTTYPVDVMIKSKQNGDSGYAWSTATLTGVATRQPPFAQSHIIAQLGNPGFGNGVAFIDEEVTLFNSGNIASGPVTLRFYLASTANTSSVSGDTPLPIGKGFTYTTLSIKPGQAISGSVSDIALPTGGARGKFLIMQVITNDPIGNHMDYPRIFADPSPLID